MATILHISASPRGERSESTSLADAFLEGARSVRPDLQVARWNLWEESPPPFGPTYAHAKMAVFAGQDLTVDQAEAWRTVRQTFDRFDAVDDYLFSVPMWNAGVPYILKQLIDVISQPGLVFGFDAEQGYTGLLRNKRAVVAYTSAVYGQDRPVAFGADFQSTFFEDWLRWAGVTDVRSVEFRPNLATPAADRGRRDAHRRAVSIGREFAQERSDVA